MKKIVLSSLLLLSAPAWAETYDIDAAHSTVGFRIKHLVSKVSGRFTGFEGGYDYEAGAPKAWKAWAKIKAASIDTDNEKRDAHLRSADFFDTDKCPLIEFKSTKVSGLKDGKAKLHGELTMHCVTKPVVLDLEVGGEGKDPWGNQRSGFTATGKINREDFGIVWNKTLESGGILLGKDVEVSLDIEGIAKPKK